MGVIGCGAIAQAMHLPHMFDYPEHFNVVALADTSRPTVDAVGNRYGVADRTTDWREIMQRDDIDAVALFHGGSHYPTLVAALDAGKHVLVEKPMTWSLSEAVEVAEHARRSERVVQVGYHKLYDPAFAYTKQQLAKMRDVGFGRITVLHPDNQLGLSPHRILRGGSSIDEGHVEPQPAEEVVAGALKGSLSDALRADVDMALGARKDNAALRVAHGFLTVSIIHQIYMLYGFLGAPQRVISTDIWRGGLSIHSVIKYSDDLHITLDWHYLSHVKDYREEYAFYGHHDRVTMQLPAPYFRNFPSPVIMQGGDGELAWEKRVVVSYEEAFRLELTAFYENVQAGRQPQWGAVDDAVQHMGFIQQIIDAAR
jgi:predicted dehydrogenase